MLLLHDETLLMGTFCCSSVTHYISPVEINLTLWYPNAAFCSVHQARSHIKFCNSMRPWDFLCRIKKNFLQSYLSCSSLYVNFSANKEPKFSKVSFIILRHCRTHWPCWLRTWGGASSLTKTLISQSAMCTFDSAFTLVTLALSVKCRRTLKGTLILKRNGYKVAILALCMKWSCHCQTITVWLVSILMVSVSINNL